MDEIAKQYQPVLLYMAMGLRVIESQVLSCTVKGGSEIGHALRSYFGLGRCFVVLDIGDSINGAAEKVA